jgi:hypothetical protein
MSRRVRDEEGDITGKMRRPKTVLYSEVNSLSSRRGRAAWSCRIGIGLDNGSSFHIDKRCTIRQLSMVFRKLNVIKHIYVTIVAYS